MRPITAWLLKSLGVLLVIAPHPVSAAVLRQSFEITVTSVRPPNLSNQTNFAPPPETQALYSALNALPVPSIGTKGLGSYTYDESQLNFAREFSPYEDTYTLGRPGKIAFLDFSLNFFNRTYTQLFYLPSRIGEFFTYTRTSTGQYLPQSLNLLTSDGTSVLTTLGGGGNFFNYRPGPVNLAGVNSVFSVSGTLRFTDVEAIPEPSAIVPVVALGLGWLYRRKLQ